MKLANIVPISLLDAIPENQRTHLVLSELILTNERYYKFYSERRNRGDLIILDNPVHEDRPVSLDRWLEAVELLVPNVAVIPDVIDSDTDTITSAKRAVALWKKRGYAGIELMAVPHGKTQLDWYDCAKRLSLIPEITWFGISLERRFNDDVRALERRRERVRLMSVDPSLMRLNLHLLGVSECADELGNGVIWSRAASADASKFAVWYLSGYRISPPAPVLAAYPGRGPFGGSYGYFFADIPPEISVEGLSENLRNWVEFAERDRSV